LNRGVQHDIYRRLHEAAATLILFLRKDNRKTNKMTTVKEKEIYIKYDGLDTKKFREWSTKIRAIAAKGKWLEGITTDTTLDRKSVDAGMIESVKKNDKAYHYLVMACTGQAFNYVQAAEDADSVGNARTAWKDLNKRYSDLTETDLIVLTTEFNDCKIKSITDDPTLWYAELEHIHLKMQKAGATKKSELEIVATIMTQIPKDYKVATQAIRTKPLAERKLELVKNVYWEFWHSNLKNSDTKEKTAQQENVALYTNDAKTQGNQGKKPWKKYKGNCSWCRIQGHKAVNCRKRQAAEHKDGTKVPEEQKKCY